MANCVKMGLGGLNISVVIVLLPKQIPLLRRVQRAEELLSEQHSHRHVYPSAMEKGSSVCGCPGDGPCEVQAVNLYSTSGLSGGIMLQKCIVSVSRCITGFSCDLRLLQAVCQEKSFPDCAHANRYLRSHSLWLPLQHYFHTLVCCSLSLNFLLLHVV